MPKSLPDFHQSTNSSWKVNEAKLGWK